MYNAKAYSAGSATGPLAPITVQRRDPTGHDVEIEVLFCVICHSDLHQEFREFRGVSSFGVSEFRGQATKLLNSGFRAMSRPSPTMDVVWLTKMHREATGDRERRGYLGVS